MPSTVSCRMPGWGIWLQSESGFPTRALKGFLPERSAPRTVSQEHRKARRVYLGFFFPFLP